MDRDQVISIVREFVKNDFIKSFGKFENEILVRPQGIYLKNTFDEDIDVAYRVLRKRLEIEPTAKIILACGFANLRKGVDLFYEIANQISVEAKELKCYFVWMGEWDVTLKDKLKLQTKKVFQIG